MTTRSPDPREIEDKEEKKKKEKGAKCGGTIRRPQLRGRSTIAYRRITFQGVESVQEAGNVADSAIIGACAGVLLMAEGANSAYEGVRRNYLALSRLDADATRGQTASRSASLRHHSAH